MKKILLTLCVVLLLSGCGAEAAPSVAASAPPPAPPTRESNTEQSGPPTPTVYTPDRFLTPQETVEVYFAQHYKAYTSLVHNDLSSLLDMTQNGNKNIMAWSETLALRRRLLKENGLCYVETAQLPYTITYDAVPQDNRMEFWQGRDLSDGDYVVLHLRITGEKGRAYPPIMAMNAQHTLFLEEVDGRWKIHHHYFPGAVRKFMRSGTLHVPSEEEMLESLRDEFAPADAPESEAIPDSATPYAPRDAVAYAMRYTEAANPAFYDIGDWMGNCANFVSQCVWAGFGGDLDANPADSPYMTDQWYGGDGGSPAWENVNYFWEDITEPGGLTGQELGNLSQLETGDIIQYRSRVDSGDEDRYNHMLVVVDAEKLLLAQNSPGCFVYYSDIFNIDTRFVRPLYLSS